MLAAICAICSSECVLGFRANGISLSNSHSSICLTIAFKTIRALVRRLSVVPEYQLPISVVNRKIRGASRDGQILVAKLKGNDQTTTNRCGREYVGPF